MITKTILNTSIAMTTVLALTACGGGSGGGSSSDNSSNGNSSFDTVVPEESLLLNRDNTIEVSHHVATLVLDVEDLVSAINISVLDNASSSKSAYVRPLNSDIVENQPRRLSTVGICESGSVSTNANRVADFDDCEYSNTLYNGEVDLDIIISGVPSVGGKFAYAGEGLADNGRTYHYRCKQLYC